jgi:CRISPR-associated protein Cas1
MSVVYVISDHGKLHRTNAIFEFVSQNGTIHRIFPHKLDSLIISGMVSITGQAMRLLMEHQINTIFTTAHGKFNGKLVFSESKNIFLRKKQYALSADEQKALPLAKAIVSA